MKYYTVRIIDLDKQVVIEASDEADLLNKLMVKYRGKDYEILSMKEYDDRDISTRTLQDYFPFDF